MLECFQMWSPNQTRTCGRQTTSNASVAPSLVPTQRANGYRLYKICNAPSLHCKSYTIYSHLLFGLAKGTAPQTDRPCGRHTTSEVSVVPSRMPTQRSLGDDRVVTHMRYSQRWFNSHLRPPHHIKRVCGAVPYAHKHVVIPAVRNHHMRATCATYSSSSSICCCRTAICCIWRCSTAASVSCYGCCVFYRRSATAAATCCCCCL
jgi:hypothetical protein